jgi:hypothetical protein
MFVPLFRELTRGVFCFVLFICLNYPWENLAGESVLLSRFRVVEFW